jgi:hypothetical protein
MKRLQDPIGQVLELAQIVDSWIPPVLFID